MVAIFIKKYQTLMSILLFLIVYYIIQYDKPLFIYNVDGTLRQFGVGYKKKTILPIWLLAILLAIISYMIVKYIIIFS
jgi:hypothetical protein